MAKRDLKDDELALWQNYTLAVEPLKKHSKKKIFKNLPKFSKEQKEKQQDLKHYAMKSESFSAQMERQKDINFLALKQTLSSPSLKRKTTVRPHGLYVGVRRSGIDNTQWKKLVKGQIIVEGKLDLHGYTVQDAFDVFCHFMQRAKQLNWRCVEIITGLGSGVYGGMIRQEFPHWLQRKEIGEMILSVVHTHAGNQGAVRLLLKRKPRF